MGWGRHGGSAGVWELVAEQSAKLVSSFSFLQAGIERSNVVSDCRRQAPFLLVHQRRRCVKVKEVEASARAELVAGVF